ncbi:PAS domain S-box-containing protein [Desulfacinum hydrothermale DSM 13146]|uniref:histidine kinase n=2 Tax=Desulfacinum hydrothermale TaxID=109258 RepID=A0A1W1XG18_9BACT|nr:PAS domain S-box-containing protein [Desulfacinum hydrothermale DSM 13146]
MGEKKRTIMFGFHSPVDRRLMREWVVGVGHEVLENLDESSNVDLILMDSATARRLRDKAFGLKRAAKYFLPVLVCIKAGENASPWLKAGFDDVLHLPATKDEWLARMDIMLRLRRQSEELGQRSEYLHRALIESSGDHIFLLDANGTFVTSNDRVTHFGLESGAQLVGRTIEQVFPKEVATFYREQFQRVLTEGKTVVFEHDLPSERGTHYHLDTLYPIHLPDGTVAVGGICRDITERKQAAEALRESRERLNHLFTVSPAIVYELDPENLSPTWVSSNITEITGYTPEEAFQPGWWAEHVHPEDQEQTKKAEERFLLEGRDRGAHEYRFEKKDGTYIWVRDELRLLRDEQGRPKEIVGSWMNITDRKEVEIELAKSEQRYRSVFESTGTAMLIVNEDGTIAFANSQCSATTGYLPEELPGTNWRGYVFAEDLPMMESYFRLRFSDPEKAPKRYETRLMHADGSIRNTLLTVGTIPATRQVVVSMLDITDLVRAEEARRLLETAIDNTIECIMLSDRENRLTYVNRAFEKLTGYSAAEVLGKTLGILKSGRHDREFYQDLKSTIYSGRPWQGNMILKKKNGELYEVAASITPILSPSGHVDYFVSVHRDVTKEREMERRIQQNQRLEAIGTLAGGIAHDFNNILTPIVGYTEMCMYSLPRGSKIRENLEAVNRAAARASDLVQQILSFSRRSNQERKPIRIALIIKEALKLLRSTIPTSIEIRQDISATEESVIADPTEIHQVIMNLCINASHAMPDGGLMSVGLHAVDLDREAIKMIPGCKPGRHLKLSVEDTGHGIAPEILDKIFEPYFTTKKEGLGTGLGLATTHSIVTACGGGITVYSEPGKGSRFDLYFPVARGVATQVVEKTAVIRGGHERVLIVDDDMEVLDLHRKVLENYGYSVTAETDPEKALALFEKSPADFDMVLTDMTMPRMTGDLLAAALLKIRPDLPVIVLTGFSERINKDKAQELGIRALLAKPVSVSDLLSTIRDIFNAQ